MKTIIKSLPCLLFLLSLQIANGQSTSNNNIPGVGKFLGYNGGGIDLDFRTNNIDRMRLMETGNTTINGYTIPAGGHLGLSLTPSFFGTGAAGRTPYSLLHLNGTNNNPGGPQTGGYRNWMQPGIIFTHNSDLMYIGPKIGEEGMDQTEAVIAWSDNFGDFVGPDVLRFLFTAGGSGTTIISDDDLVNNDYDGLEIARMHGDGRMGIGVSWNNIEQPKRTLDIMNDQQEPQLRLTYEPTDEETDGAYADFQVSKYGDLYIKPELDDVTKALAVGFLYEDIPGTVAEEPQIFLGNQTILDVNGLTRIRNIPAQGDLSCLILGTTAIQGDPEDNYLRRLDFTGNTNQYLSGDGTWETASADDCRWVNVNSTTVVNEIDMITGFPAGDDCDRGKVGIGVEDVRRAKLEVENLYTRDEINIGIYGGMNLEEEFVLQPQGFFGLYGEATKAGLGSTATMCGVKGFAKDSRYQVGVFGESESVQNFTGHSMGVAGLSSGDFGSLAIGVYGESTTSNFGGYFVGGISTTGGPLIISDEAVKTNVEDLANATAILAQLAPKTYTFVSPDNREIPFDEGTRYGFIAQELQEILPVLVEETTIPERIDSTGFVEGTSVDLLGIKYTELIPILVSGFNEQNAIIEAQQAALAQQMEENVSLQDEIAELNQQLENQENEISEIKQQMNALMTSFQSTQSKMNNCCDQAPIEKSQSRDGNIRLDQNFPNPFESSTTINFSINTAAQIRLEISDANGRVLETLINSRLEEGNYSEIWDATNYASGTYYYSLYADTELLTKKMIKK